MLDDRSSRDLDSVYQNTENLARPRAFYVDIWDEDTDTMEHAFYGVTGPDGSGGMARPMTGNGLFSIRSADAFADRFDGEVVWL